MLPSMSDDGMFLSTEITSRMDSGEPSCIFLFLIADAVLLSVDKQRMNVKNGPVYSDKQREEYGGMVQTNRVDLTLGDTKGQNDEPSRTWPDERNQEYAQVIPKVQKHYLHNTNRSKSVWY